MNTEVLRGTLILLQFAGAANADASPEQRARLKPLVDLLRDKSLTVSESYRAFGEGIIEVMGPDWAPSGEWAEYIDVLMAEKTADAVS